MDDWLQGIVDWIDGLTIHAAVQDAGWVVPAVQSVHIAAVAVVLTGALILALRGMELVGRHWSLTRWSRYFHGSTIAALWVLLATGLLMILAEPERELMNWIFRAKMLTVIVTLLIAQTMSRRLRRGGHSPVPVGGGVRLTAILILLLWTGVATAGRWIAYAG
ncbi:MAG TPA: DUF6644 family protein [Sphingobium sp.]|nr:DUF6644 family protein [Sphingobium sp.]